MCGLCNRFIIKTVAPIVGRFLYAFQCKKKKKNDYNTWSYIDWFQLFMHFFFLSFFITSCSCSKVFLFNPISQFYYRNDSIFSTKGHNYQIIISCTRLKTFEKKRENDRKDRVWRQARSYIALV